MRPHLGLLPSNCLDYSVLQLITELSRAIDKLPGRADGERCQHCHQLGSSFQPGSSFQSPPTKGWTYVQWRIDLLPSFAAKICMDCFWGYAMLFWLAEAFLKKNYPGHC